MQSIKWPKLVEQKNWTLGISIYKSYWSINSSEECCRRSLYNHFRIKGSHDRVLPSLIVNRVCCPAPNRTKSSSNPLQKFPVHLGIFSTKRNYINKEWTMIYIYDWCSDNSGKRGKQLYTIPITGPLVARNPFWVQTVTSSSDCSSSAIDIKYSKEAS